MTPKKPGPPAESSLLTFTKEQINALLQNYLDARGDVFLLVASLQRATVDLILLIPPGTRRGIAIAETGQVFLLLEKLATLPTAEAEKHLDEMVKQRILDNLPPLLPDPEH